MTQNKPYVNINGKAWIDLTQPSNWTARLLTGMEMEKQVLKDVY